MNKLSIFLFLLCVSLASLAQDSTNTDVFDPSQYTDATNEKKFCTQKVINQTPTRLVSLGYEHNFAHIHSYQFSKILPAVSENKLQGMGGLRTSISLLAFSTNKLIVSIGTTYWGSRIRSNKKTFSASMQQIYDNTMHIEGLNVLAFKPLNEKHFIIAQGNVDASYVSYDDTWRLTKPSLTLYGSAMYGWKKGDYRMLAVGVSRTYRLGRPIVVPILLYNKTFSDKWGVECLLPARAHARYNFSSNNMLLAGYELEGQQFDLGASDDFLQRGEIKPRIMWEKKIIGFFWLGAQLGYRIPGRFSIVDKYNGKERDEIIRTYRNGSPYFNISINFVSP